VAHCLDLLCSCVDGFQSSILPVVFEKNLPGSCLTDSPFTPLPCPHSSGHIIPHWVFLHPHTTQEMFASQFRLGAGGTFAFHLEIKFEPNKWQCHTKSFPIHPYHTVATWKVNLGFPNLGRIKINKIIHEGKNLDFEQKQVSHDLPILGSLHSMGYMEFSQVCNLGVMTGKNWFLKKEKPCILF
jgi:hypothetical protein